RDVQTYLKERIREVLTGASDAVVIRIYGQDLHVLQSKAKEVKEALKDIKGIADLKVEVHSDIPQVEVELDQAAARRYGINPGDVRRATAVMMSGEEVGDMFLNGKDYLVDVWSTPETRESVTSIRDLLLSTRTRSHVRLGEIADVRIRPTPNVVERVGQSRKIDVSANVKGRALGSVAKDAERAVQAGLLTILGIATRNGIMMISHFQHLEEYEGERFGPALVLRGARERIAPILMTALATGLALVPLVIRGNIPGQEIQHPMAMVILGGLFTSTLLNLIVVPSLYLRFGKRPVLKA